MSFENLPTRPALAAKWRDPVVQVTLAALAAVAAIAAIAALLLDLGDDDEAVLIGAVLALAALQVPVAALLARRLRQRHRAREALLLGEIDASWVERRRIARKLHDGVVQELAATSFSVAAMARRADHLPGSESEALGEIGARVRGSVRDLTGLSAEIYPLEVPDLKEDLQKLRTLLENDR